jgi:predicted transcriptional regulator
MFAEQGDERRARRIREAQARTKAEETRRALLALLREGPLSTAELRAKLGGEVTVSVLNYHLGVLVSGGEIVAEDDDLYRLA